MDVNIQQLSFNIKNMQNVNYDSMLSSLELYY